MIVFVHAVKKENDGDAFAGIVEMIAAEKEAIGIGWIVVSKIVFQIQRYDLFTVSLSLPSSVLIMVEPIT